MHAVYIQLSARSEPAPHEHHAKAETLRKITEHGDMLAALHELERQAVRPPSEGTRTGRGGRALQGWGAGRMLGGRDLY